MRGTRTNPYLKCAALYMACAVFAVACRNTPSTAKTDVAEKSTESGSTAQRGNETKTPDGTRPLFEIHEIVPGGECSDPGPAHAADIAAASKAVIPLKVGLTLSHVWKSNADDYEHECL